MKHAQFSGYATLDAIARSLEKNIKKMDKSILADERDIQRGGPAKRQNEKLITRRALLKWRGKDSNAQKRELELAQSEIAELEKLEKARMKRSRAKKPAADAPPPFVGPIVTHASDDDAD